MRPEWEEVEAYRKRTEERSSKLIIAGIAMAAALLLVSNLQQARDGERSSAQAVAPAEKVPENPSEPTAHAPASPTPLAPLPTEPRGRKYVGVYECMRGDQRVFSDQPCGESAKTRSLVVDQPVPTHAPPQLRQLHANETGSQQAASARSVDGAMRCLYVQSRVTSEWKVHTCRWFDSSRQCYEAADRMGGRCGEKLD